MVGKSGPSNGKESKKVVKDRIFDNSLSESPDFSTDERPHSSVGPISDVLSDLTIEVGSASFALHKVLLEAKDTKVSRINLIGLPSGSDTFELAAKFYYGVKVDINISNVALLRCAARFMEMTEDIAKKNLEIRTKVFLKDVVFQNISNSISVLHRCETLLPVSEKVNLVSQLTNAIANNVCKEQLISVFSKLEYNFPPKPAQCVDSETLSDWWGKSLAVLNLDFF
ncbi:BTB/POZ domain-containing protein SETH6 [Capsicum baccatum]|uniref:BTB/POZ domain-containing protein SETH6 n=1 Tax=Capsicum baccatum TaxID=33114 RepID=A0A2G2VLL8_CAPBA|nr:BTB/POZ domain-containing protein SETH6 [Capsicum baccatum]